MYLLDFRFVKLWLHNLVYLCWERAKGDGEGRKEITEATTRSCQLKVMSVQWWNFTTSGCLADGTINSRRNQGKQQLWSEAGVSASVRGCLSAYVCLRSESPVFHVSPSRALMSELLRSGIPPPLSPGKQEPVGEAHASIFGLTTVSFLVSALMLRMEPKVQAEIVKQEASNQVLLTIMLHPSEHRADGPQHVITNIDCCFKEKRFLIIIKHSHAGRESCIYTHLVASVLPSFQMRAQREPQTGKGEGRRWRSAFQW